MSEAAATPGRPHVGTVPSNGITIAYREWATGDTAGEPLLLLHGLASAAVFWDLVAPLLATERRVVALDQRGHGQSEKPERGYDFATIVADDLGAADALHLGDRFAVVGHSWGGNVALELAAWHPERVSALVLIDMPVGWVRASGQSFAEVWERLAPPDYAGTPRETFLAWGRRSIPGARPEVDEIRLNIVELRPDDTVGPRLARENHKQILRALYDGQHEREFARVRCPVLMLMAESAPSDAAAAEALATKRANVEHARTLLTGSPRVEVIWMPDAVHDVPLQRPEAVAARIRAFLSALE